MSKRRFAVVLLGLLFALPLAALGDTLGFVDAGGRPAATFAAGERVYLRLEAPQPNTDPSSRDVAMVTVLVGSDHETVYLSETGADTGVFMGGAESRWEGILQDNGTLEVFPPGQTMTATYDGGGGGTLQATATLVESRASLVDAQGAPADFYLELTKAYVQVAYRPYIFRPYIVETISVTLTSANAGDSESVTLTETGPDTGLFTGSIPFARSVVTTPGSGALEVRESSGPPYQHDTVSVSFTGSSLTSTDSAPVLGSLTAFLDAYGNEVSFYPAGATLHLRVEDHNFDNPYSVDSVTATVQSLTTQDAETVTLYELHQEGGIFEGSLPTQVGEAASPGNSLLEVDPVETLEAMHVDANGVLASGAQAQVRFAKIEFIDEAGRPTSEALMNGTARLRVLSLADNTDSSQANQVTVEVRSRYADDVETLILTETGADTGVFEGSIRVQNSTRVAGDGILDALEGATAEELTATFGAASATARVILSRIFFLDASGRETSTVVLGEPFRLRVVDHLRNGSPTAQDDTMVQLFTNGGDNETVYLYETGPDTGVFEGAISTDTGTLSGNGTLEGAAGYIVTAEHQNFNHPEPARAQAVFVGSQLTFLDDEGQPAAVLLEGKGARLRVVDHRANLYFYSRQTVTVEVRVVSGDVETLTLEETGEDTGVFETFVNFQRGSAYAGNGIVETSVSGAVRAVDTVHAQYTTAFSTEVVKTSIEVVDGRIWFIDASGAVTASFAQGSVVRVRVEDHIGRTSNPIDSVWVRLTSSSGDQESLLLQETGAGTGIYEGSLPLGTGAPFLGDERLQAAAGAEIFAVRDVPYLSEAARATIAYGSLEFLDEAGRPTLEILEHGPARLRLISFGDNQSPSAAETVEVEVTSRFGGDLEVFTLTETGPDTGVFEATIRLIYGNAGQGNGTLETRDSDAPQYLFDEVVARYGPVSLKVRVAPSRVVFIDAFGRETDSLVVGRPVRIRAWDYGRTSPDYLSNGILTLQGCGDTETLYFEETAIDSSVFEGELQSTASSSFAGDGVLRGFAGCEVVARYPNSVPVETLARATFKSGDLTFVDAQGNLATAFLMGTRAYLRAEVPGANFNPSTRDTLSVEARSDLTGDTLQVQLEETGDNTGVFIGSFQVVQGPASPWNNWLEVDEADTMRARLQLSPGEVLEASAATLTHRIWFLDAFGQVVDSYSQGQRVYVRIEDHRFGNPSVPDPIYARVTSTSGDSLSVELMETGSATGVFEGSAALDSVNPPGPDNVLQAAPGAEITAVRDGYDDTVSARATIESAAIELIDDAGRPTATVLENDTARVRLYSAQSNHSPAVADSLPVAISSLHGDDQEEVVLTETGPDTGVFEGAIELRLGQANPGNDLLETGISGALGDELTASYGPYSATARTVGARLVFLDAFGRETTRLTLGAPVRVRVTDYRRDDPLVRDEYPVDVGGCGDYEVFTVQETGFHTGVYEGSIASVTGFGNGGDGMLSGFIDCTVTASWVDVDRPRLAAQAVFGGGSLAFTDAQGNLADTFLEGTQAYVRLEMPGGNFNPSSRDSSSVEVRSELTGDLVNLYVEETGLNTGVFMGFVTLRRDTPYPYDSILQVSEEEGPPHRFDTLRAQLMLSSTETLTATASTLGYRVWFIDSFGQVADSYALGTRVYVRIEDHRYQNPGAFDRLYAQVTSSTGDVVYIELLETGKATGVYEGSVALDSLHPPSPDNVLQAAPGAEITAVRDAYFTDSPARATIEFAALEFIDEAGRPVAAVLENGVARVRLYSAQGNGNPAAADSLSVEISSLYANDEEEMFLTETGPDTGVFEGSIQLRYVTSGNPGNGTLETGNGGAPAYQGDELTASYGSYSASVRAVGARLVFLDAFGRETTRLSLGAPVRVRVTDHRRDDPGLRDEHPIDVEGCGDYETFTVQETGFHTGVYEGSIASVTGFGNSGDGRLSGFVDCAVTAHWVDVDRPRLAAQAVFGGGSLAFVDAEGNLADTFLEGSRAYVRLEMPGANFNPSSPDTSSVEIRSELTGDLVNAHLEETGLNTGVFMGFITLRRDSPYPYDNILQVSEDPGPPHTFDTLHARLMLSSTESLTATASTLNYRVWFIDSFGQVTDSYPLGSRAYVRIEDHRFGSPALFDYSYAQVTSSSGDMVYFELMETGKATGIFEGSVAVDNVNPITPDSILQAGSGARITARRDGLDFAASPAEATIESAAIEFIDAAGQPAATVLENDAARVRLYSAQNNGNPAAADSLSVQIRSLYAGDQEPVTLTETGPDTGVFEGSIQLRYVPSGYPNGTLETTNSGAPAYLGDELTASYGPYSAKARTVGARVVFVDAFGRETTRLSLGAPVRVRVTDYRRDDPGLRDEHPIDVEGCGDYEAFTVQETGFHTGVYEGSIASVTGFGNSGDGRLSGFIDCTVTAHWVDVDRPRLAAQAVFGGGSLAFTDAEGNLADTFLEGTRAYVRLEMPGANFNPSSRDSSGVEVYSELTGDTVGVFVEETGVNTGVFMGSVLLRRDTPSPYDNILQISEEQGPPHEFDTLLARLMLSSTETLTATASTLSYRVWFIDAFGQETDSYPLGSRVSVRIEDHRFGSPSLFDLSSARVTSSSGDSVYFELLETGKATGIFEGSVTLDGVSPPSPDNMLQAGPGSELTAVRDGLDFAASPARATIEFASIEFIDGAGQPAATVLENDVARVRLYSAQGNGNPAAADSLAVAISSLYGPDQEAITLTETGPDTGVFEGSIQLRYAGVAYPGNGTLETANSGSPAYLGDDLTARYGPYSASVRTVGARVVFVDNFGRETTKLSLGSPVRVRVTDYRRDDPGLRDEYPIDVEGCGDYEVFTVQETGFHTGVYEGSIASSTGFVNSGDGVLSGFIDCAVTARWVDLDRPRLSTQAVFGGGALAFVDAQGNLAATFLEGGRAYVRLEMPGANYDPASLNSADVEVRSELTGDAVNVFLEETGVNTGVFLGSVSLRRDTPSPYDNVLQISEEQGPPHEFDTLHARLMLSSTEVLTATASTLSYRVWFIGSAGQVVDSYAQGTRVYVRIEDHRYGGPGSVDQTVARVTSSSGDSVTFLLQETGNDTGIFEGSVALDSVSQPSPDDVLQAAPGAGITAVRDGYDFHASPAQATIALAALEILDESGAPASEVMEGSEIRVRLYSTQDNVNPSSPDTAQVQLSSLYGQDSETVTLAETGANTGIFEGLTDLAIGPGLPANGILETRNSGSPGYQPDVVTASYGPYSATVSTVSARVAFLDFGGEVTTSYPLRSLIRLRVEDHNRDQTSGVDSFPVTIHSVGTSDQETITMVETGDTTGVFLGSMPNYDIGAVFYDGMLSVFAGQTVEVLYMTPSRPEVLLVEATFRGSYLPQMNNDAAQTVEDTTVEILVLDNDNGVNAPLTVASVTQGANGSVSIGPDQTTVFYSPSADFVGTDTFTYDARNVDGDEATATVTVTVIQDNQPPVANPDTMYVDEDGSATFNVLLNDTDPENDPLTFAGFPAGAQHGTISASSYPELFNGVTYEAVTRNWNGTDTFEYRVSDSHGNLALGTVTVIVRPVNDAPVAVNDTATVNEDGSVTITVLTNDTDVENDTLSVSSVTVETNGDATVNPDGTVTFVPTANFSGIASFDYTVSDGNGGVDVGAVTITVTGVNDVPTANADTTTVEEDGSVSINVLSNDTDPENNTLSVTAVAQGTNGAVAINPDKTVTYTPAANFSGVDSFTYTISDGNGGIATAGVSVTVTSANDAPVAVNDTATVAEDGTVAVAVLDNDADPEGDSLTVESVTQGANGAVAINANGTVSYTPAANFKGTDSFTYTVADGNGGGSTATVDVTVTSVNDAPVANDDIGTVSEDGSVDIDVVANDTDADNDTLTVTSVTQGNGGSVSINANGTVKYSPSTNFSGSDSFTYTVSDGNGGNALATVTITVNADNDAPTATDDSAAVAEDGSVSITVLANDSDPENDTLSVSSVTQGAHGAVAIDANGTVTYTPAANYHGGDSFTYTVSDGNGGTDTATVTVSVSSVNDAPVANDDIATVSEDGSTSFSVLGNDTDVDGDSLSVVTVTQGTSGSVSINANGTLMYTPAANFHGTDNFTYTVRDGNGGADTAAVTVTISAVNDPPSANADSGVVAEDGSVNIAVLGNDSDPESDVLTVTAVTQGSFGAVSINPDKTVRYVPSANYNGADSFTYTISDGNGGTATASVTVTVTAVNDVPVAVNDSASVVAGTAVTISVLPNDSDIDSPTLTITGVTQGAKGSVVTNANDLNGTVTYVAGLFSGTDSFTYTISDGAGGTATATVTVTLQAPARVASGIQARYNFNEGSGNVVNDTSGVGTPLNLTISSTSAVTWISNGLSVNTATSITNNSNATKIINAVRASNALTVEAWITPDSLSLTGPARILQLWKNNSQRNLVFGQSGSRYETLLRTSTGTPSLLSPTASVTLDLVHLVYTRNSAGQTVYYINGTQVSSGTASGNLSSWATDHKLALADNWRGDYFLLAVYDRALAAGEVQQNYLAGRDAN